MWSADMGFAIEHQILAAILISQVRDRGGEVAGLGATLLDALLASSEAGG